MANQWFRLYHEFATDPKIQMLSESDQRRYVMLLCLKCCNGDVTLQDEEVAFQLRISNEEWRETKRVLQQKGLITEDNKPSAWDKRQFASDSSAERVAKHRAKKAKHEKRPCNVTVTPPDTETDTETEEKNKQKKSQKQKPVSGFVLPDWIDKKLFDDFLVLRKQLRAVNSDRALNNLVTELEELSGKNAQAANELINQSITNSWKTVYPLKDKAVRKSNNEPPRLQALN